MEEFFKPQFTWWNFLVIATIIVLLYFLLHFLNRILVKFTFLGNYQPQVKKMIHYSILLYEAIALIVLGGVFIFINPIYNGLIVLVLLLASFHHVRNYFNGRFILFDNVVSEGKRMQIADSQGVIFRMGRMGLRLKTNKGLKFISYSTILEEGYTMLSGSEVGGFHHLNIQPVEVDEKVNYFLKLTDLLNSTPYIDWKHKPQVLPQKDISKTMEARVVVKEESHLRDLITMIEEQGFHCRTIS